MTRVNAGAHCSPSMGMGEPSSAVSGAASLRVYVAAHNRGVVSGDFSELVGRFAADGQLEFDGFAIGPFVGRDAIAEAFRLRPPTDELVLLSAGAGERVATALFR